MTALFFWTLMMASLDVLAAGKPIVSVTSPAVSPVPAISATGIGYPPRHMQGTQARLMARRAAEVDAMRNLSIKLGLPKQARLGPFRYVSERSVAGGGVEVTVESQSRGSAPPCGTPARPKCVPRSKP